MGTALKRHVHEYVVLDGEREPPGLACADCGARLCAWDENYREHATVLDTPLEELGALFGAFAHTLDDRMVHRAYHCPACGRRLDSEICPEAAGHLRDLMLDDPYAVLGLEPPR